MLRMNPTRLCSGAWLGEYGEEDTRPMYLLQTQSSWNPESITDLKMIVDPPSTIQIYELGRHSCHLMPIESQVARENLKKVRVAEIKKNDRKEGPCSSSANWDAWDPSTRPCGSGRIMPNFFIILPREGDC